MPLVIIGVQTYIGCLVTTIDAGQDMTTGDIYNCITINSTCRTKPFVSSDCSLVILDFIRVISGTATEYTTIIGVAICTCSTCITCFIRVIRQEWRLVIPANTLLECGRIFISPFTISIYLRNGLVSYGFRITRTNLTTLNFYMGITKYTTILTTAIDRGHDKTTAYGHIGIVYIGMEVGILVNSRIFHYTSTATEYEAHVNRTFATFIFHTFRGNFKRSYLTAINYDSTCTSSSIA